jgi:hypothetical protein
MWHISTLFRTINWRHTWSKVLFEKLSVVQLLCNFTLCITGTPITAFTRNHNLSQPWARLVNSTPPNLFLWDPINVLCVLCVMSLCLQIFQKDLFAMFVSENGLHFTDDALTYKHATKQAYSCYIDFHPSDIAQRFSLLCSCVPMFGTAPFVITDLITVFSTFRDLFRQIEWDHEPGKSPSAPLTQLQTSLSAQSVCEFETFLASRIFLRTNLPSIYGLSCYFIHFCYWHFRSSWYQTEFSCWKWTPPMFLKVCLSQEITSTFFWICVSAEKVRLG